MLLQAVLFFALPALSVPSPNRSPIVATLLRQRSPEQAASLGRDPVLERAYALLGHDALIERAASGPAHSAYLSAVRSYVSGLKELAEEVNSI